MKKARVFKRGSRYFGVITEENEKIADDFDPVIEEAKVFYGSSDFKTIKDQAIDWAREENFFLSSKVEEILF